MSSSSTPATNNNDDSDIDLVKKVFEHFDEDKNGFLNFVETSALQLQTSGVKMTSEQYALACQTLECHPNMGLSLKALRWTYAADGSNIEEDYEKLFGKLPPKKQSNMEDDVYEVGDEGVDISCKPCHKS